MADWLRFVEDQPPEERAQYLPAIQSSAGSISIGRDGSSWRLTIQPSAKTYSALAGKSIEYEGRRSRQVQDWLRFPISGVSVDEASTYASWLDRTRRVPGARLCFEDEWERAARGADARKFPHGDRLDPDDADFDETYGRNSLGFGPDEVGSHKISESPFGALDMSANAAEWTMSVANRGEWISRSGSWFFQRLTDRINNRSPSERKQKDVRTGFRVCADLRDY